jgi:hypothetical protein
MVGVGVTVVVGVTVFVGVIVGVGVTVSVIVGVTVAVGVIVGVTVGVIVNVGVIVGVGDGLTHPINVPPLYEILLYGFGVSNETISINVTLSVNPIPVYGIYVLDSDDELVTPVYVCDNILST